MPNGEKPGRDDRLFRALGAAYDRYERREAAFRTADQESQIWRWGESALGMVKQARDLAGRLESELYDAH